VKRKKTRVCLEGWSSATVPAEKVGGDRRLWQLRFVLRKKVFLLLNFGFSVSLCLSASSLKAFIYNVDNPKK
jgi:hypothetical protein